MVPYARYLCGHPYTDGHAEGLYDPRLYNDRLLLGLKSTMNEVEGLVEEFYEQIARILDRTRSSPGSTKATGSSSSVNACRAARKPLQ